MLVNEAVIRVSTYLTAAANLCAGVHTSDATTEKPHIGPFASSWPSRRW